MKKNKALILLNMGGISNEQEVEIFLRNMFNDENIITTKSSLLRKFIANMIVFFRLKEAKKNYSYINFNSPLLKITKSLRSKLEKILPKHIVTFAMRYTYPFFSDTIKQIQKKKLKEIILFPMYPQYSTTTTKSSLDDALLYIEKYFPNAKITIVKRFYENKRFVKLVVDEIVKKIPKNSDISSYDLVFSAHSLPESIIKNGDSYEQEIQHNVHLLTNELKRRKQLPKDITIAYQSKLGPVKWLSPSLEYV